jgi:ribosome maturation factor RimP
MESVPKKNIDRLSKIAAKAAEGLGLQLLRLTARGTPSRAIIEFVLDGPKLVSIGDCETVSRRLNEAIESESLVGGNFRLDVLSPGLDEPIVHDYQFQRTIGHLVEIGFEDGEKKQTVTGTLNGASSDEITVTRRQAKRATKSEKGEEVRIKRSQIVSVFARPDFG